MKKITIGIIAHVDSGKTTLSEAMLYLSGAIRKYGRVDKGESFLDNDEMERRRGITIYSKQARFTYGSTEFVLIDTPGHADFSAEMERSLQVLDYAVLLISASDGIKGQTETLWKMLAEYELPAFVFFNKMDQDGADRVVLFNSFKKSFTSDLVDFTAGKKEDIYDAAAMCSEEAMECYLETGEIPVEMMQQLILDRKMFPCFFGHALEREIQPDNPFRRPAAAEKTMGTRGVKELLDALDSYTLMPDYPEEFGARAYKILRENDGSRLTFVKITGGRLKNKTVLPDGDGQSKINQIRYYSGSRFSTKETAEAGDICALAGLKESFAGQGFGIEEESVLPLMVPILNYRVLLPAGEDPVRVLPYFKILEEENPELTVAWDEEHNEISVCVMGDVQLEILTNLVKERFDLAVTFDSGEVMYKETISQPVVGVGHFEPLRHYAEVHLLMEPLPAGSGLIFETNVRTDMLAMNWQRLILTHLEERQHRGVLTGAPITDMRISVIGGKAHLKHTEGGDFRQAVYRAVRQGLMMTSNVLLEPYYRFSLEVPTGSVGRALNDLDRIHAQFGMPELNEAKGTSVIKGRAAVSALKNYPREIAAYTQGQGSVTMVNDGYDVCRNAEDVILNKGYDPQADLRNTPDSVFCSHGAGVVIPYDQVYDYMHLSLDGTEENSTSFEIDEEAAKRRHEKRERSLGTEEIDAIIASISRSGNKEEQKKGWKRRGSRSGRSGSTGTEGSGTGTAAAAAAGSRAVKNPAPSYPVFSMEEADYIVVDGYNVIFAWENLTDLARTNIDSARDALIDELSLLKSMVSGKVMAVFDAYRVKGHATENTVLQDVQIVYTGAEETADQYIEKFTNSREKKSRIVVVTSDHLEQVITRGQGCMLVSSRDLRARIDYLSSRMKERYNIK
ncbi:MAG: TetM/TetW/TetO/TetS family tetracycline resistance ribosomal protection protein [Parasporobacterium sp.]|nr:TetM/TetW/TetO/TetS family tetracycline resistance ribosomal protection protein [Parasporobacterium sp.]